MAALALDGPDPFAGPGPRRKRAPVTLGRVAAAGGIALALLLAWSFFSARIVTERPNAMKTTTVILPPPPPPPPEPVPQETPPEPTQAPPIEEPADTPPPDQPQSPAPTAGDSALTAREGAGPSSYGLRVGDGSGTRIGSRAGGDNGFGAYATVALSAIRLATQADRELTRGRYAVRLAVMVDAEGRITNVRVIGSSGDSRRDARLRDVLTGLQLSQRPPAGLPVMRIELATRSGA